MITGYYIRGTNTWALVEQDERYNEKIVVDGLTRVGAVALYWRKMAEFCAPATTACDASSAAPKHRRRQPPQFLLDL